MIIHVFFSSSFLVARVNVPCTLLSSCEGREWKRNNPKGNKNYNQILVQPKNQWSCRAVLKSGRVSERSFRASGVVLGGVRCSEGKFHLLDYFLLLTDVNMTSLS